MKHLIPFCFAMCLLEWSSAQIISVYPKVVVGNFQNLNLNDYNALENHVAVVNLTNETIRLRWVREIPSGCPAGWKTQVCDNVTCYVDWVSSNVIDSISLNEPFILGPKDTFETFYLKVIPGNSPGCCEPVIHFSKVEKPDEILETVTFNISINRTDCQFSISNTNEISKANVKVYPNPSYGNFSISHHDHVRLLVVYNILGREVKRFAYQQGINYDISDLPEGLYLVSMQDMSGKLLKTVRLSKKSLRP